MNGNKTTIVIQKLLTCRISLNVIITGAIIRGLEDFVDLGNSGGNFHEVERKISPLNKIYLSLLPVL
jgi:hypothetical protein